MAIIIAGNIFDGMQFYGPFDGIEDAIEWAEDRLGTNAEWLVARLKEKTDGEV